MFHLFKPKTLMAEQIMQRILYIDGLPHADICSRWEADKQVLELTRQLKEHIHG